MLSLAGQPDLLAWNLHAVCVCLSVCVWMLCVCVYCMQCVCLSVCVWMLCVCVWVAIYSIPLLGVLTRVLLCICVASMRSFSLGIWQPVSFAWTLLVVCICVLSVCVCVAMCALFVAYAQCIVPCLVVLACICLPGMQHVAELWASPFVRQLTALSRPQLLHGQLRFVVEFGHTVRSWMPFEAAPHGAICMAL